MAKKGKYFHVPSVRMFAEELLEYRDNNGISREKLALEIGISPRCLAKIEYCETKCTIETLAKIVNYTKIDINYVLSGN